VPGGVSQIVAFGVESWKLLTMLNERERVLLIHHRSQAGVEGRLCPFGQPQNRQLYSYRNAAEYVRLFLKANYCNTKIDKS
jgi:hypothetical protein